MDHLIFYKKNVDLKESLSKVRFSYTREYWMHITNTEEKLLKHVKQYSGALLFFFCDKLTEQNRITISNLRNRFPDLRICLCTNEIHSLEAWKLDVFHFLDHPTDNKKLIQGYNKYISNLGGVNKEFKIKRSNGLHRIPFHVVNYLRAEGNYTRIYTPKPRPVVETKQLQMYMFCTEEDLNMRRVHRSFIINMKRIRTVGNKQVHFYNTEGPLEISKALEMKLKRILLGK